MDNILYKEKESLIINQANDNFTDLPLFKHISTLPLNKIMNILEENKDKKFLTKKLGRKKKYLENSIIDNENINNEVLNGKKYHDKYSNDNIRRKIKSLFHAFLISLLNNELKQKFPKMKKKFAKMNKRITIDIGIEYNKKLFGKCIKDIIVDVSTKYTNKEQNKNCIKYIERQKDNQEIINILNMQYKELYSNHYLKSTKDDLLDNSFEAHKEKLLNKFGKEYLDLFIKNAENFIVFYTNGKNRKLRKLKEVEAINIHLDNENIETKSTNDQSNNINIDNSHKNKTMVSSCIQTDIYDINQKLIAFV